MENITIGIIDEHNLFVRSLKKLLDSYERLRVMITSENGEEFLKKLKKKDIPDIILMDINMARLNGPETTRILMEKFPDCKVIALSAHRERSYISRMILSGVCGYVFKTAEPDELIEAIDKALEGGLPFNSEALSVLRSLYASNSMDKANAKFTHKELELIKLISFEHTNTEICKIMDITKSTVETHKRKIIAKMGVKNSIGIAVYATKQGLII